MDSIGSDFFSRAGAGDAGEIMTKLQVHPLWVVSTFSFVDWANATTGRRDCSECRS